MIYYRFWIFYIRIVNKELNWKHDKNKIVFGNWISKFNIMLYFNRFDMGVNMYHFKNPDGVWDCDK